MANFADWQISSTGDLMFYEDNKANNKLKISFYTSRYPSLKIDFNLYNISSITPNNIEESLKINFNTAKIKDDHEAVLLKNEAAIDQMINIRLNTALKDIKDREDIGSKLELAKHVNMFDNTEISNIKSYVLSAIYDIAPNASCIVEPFISKIGVLKMGCRIIININDVNYEYVI